MSSLLPFGCRTTHAKVKSDVLPGGYDRTLELGSGYDKAKKQGALALCVTGSHASSAAPTSGHGEIGDLVSSENLGFDQALSLLNGNLDAGLRTNVLTAGATAELALAHSADELSKTFTFFWSGEGRSQELGRDLTVSPGGQALIEAGAVRPSCGDEFVQRIAYGASLLATLRIDFASASDKQKYGGQLSLSAVGGKGYSLGIGAGVDRAALSSRTSVAFNVRQVGGKAANLLTVVPDNLTTCTLENMSPCLQAMESVREYAAGTFRNDLGSTSQWVPVKYFTRSYQEAGIQALVTQAVSGATQDDLDYQISLINDQAVAALQNADRAQRLLASRDTLHLSQAQVQKITAYQAAAKGNAAKNQAALEYCLHEGNGATACTQYVENVLMPGLAVLRSDVLSVTGAGDVLPEVYKTDAFGGYEGVAFDGILQVSKRTAIQRVRIFKRQDLSWPVGLGLTTTASETFNYGQQHLPAAGLDLAPGDDIASVEINLSLLGNANEYGICYLKVITSKGQQISYGVPTKNKQVFTAPAGARIIGFFGRSGDWLNRLGVLYAYAN